MDIYVGNLAYTTTDDSLRAAFAAYGEVTSARVVLDRISHRSKGFGFVEMPNTSEANAAIEALNGAELDGRAIRCNESQGRDNGGGGFGGGRGRPPRREGRFGGGRGFGGERGGFRRENDRGGYGSGRGFGGERGGSYGNDRGAPRREGGYGRGGSYSGPRTPRSGSYQPRESQW